MRAIAGSNADGMRSAKNTAHKMRNLVLAVCKNLASVQRGTFPEVLAQVGGIVETHARAVVVVALVESQAVHEQLEGVGGCEGTFRQAGADFGL